LTALRETRNEVGAALNFRRVVVELIP
jgi:hypothetical protein